MKPGAFSLFILASISALTPTGAAPACRHVFAANDKALELVHADPVKQWLRWEQQSNFIEFRKNSEPLLLPVSRVKPSSVDITILDSAPALVKNLIGTGEAVNWYKHPYNTQRRVPHFDDPVVSKLVTYSTASRSAALILGKNVFSIKVGTDHPHGPLGIYSEGKAFTHEDIRSGRHRMEYIENVDKKIGADDILILAKEVAMVSDKMTEEGYLIRDLSFMNDGNYYLPAMSLPYAGRQIAAFHKKNAESFWQKHYIELLGKAKARLLLRYGLQMETPNTQNILIQLDHNLKPTGKLVFRDVSDTLFVKKFAQELGAENAIAKDAEFGMKNTDDYFPYFENSVWLFDRAGKESFSPSIFTKWNEAHDKAYFKELERALGIKLTRKFSRADLNKHFRDYMETPEVQAQIRKYRLQLERENSVAAPKTEAAAN